LRDLGILIRSALPVATIAPEIRRIVHSLDPEQPISRIETVDERLNASVSRPHFTADVLFGFSCLGTLLAMIGVYGVLSCRARAQMREIAVRQALGAQRSAIVSYMLGHAVRLIVPGVVAGIGLALLGNQLISALLFEVKPGDLGALGAVCGGVLSAALAASFLPAFRVSRLDPLVTLRQD
jgi:ABC-type antimicrobial peptide transport system permease subunit